MENLINNNKRRDIETFITDDPIEYLKIAGNLFNNQFYLSRGHTDASWKLLPPIFRDSVLSEINSNVPPGQYESILTTEFSDNYRLYFNEPVIHENDETICLITMQHYGLPTRLLDWTNNLQTSLFFAVNYSKRDRSEKKIYVIWFLNPKIYRRIYVSEGGEYLRQISERVLSRSKMSTYKILYDNPETLRFPVIFSPRFLFSRIIAQESIFSIHGWEKIAFEDMENANQFLKCIVIVDNNDTFYSYVNNILNLSYRKFFPDIQGFVEYMKRKNTK